MEDGTGGAAKPSDGGEDGKTDEPTPPPEDSKARIVVHGWGGLRLVLGEGKVKVSSSCRPSRLCRSERP